MTREGNLREHYQKGSKYITVIQYAMTSSTYDKMKSRQKKISV